MSRFINWYLIASLNTIGWPRVKGTFFKKSYVDAEIFDLTMEQVIFTSIALGAGKPKLALANLVDFFGDNPWTRESTYELIQGLNKEAELDIIKNSKLTPCQALWFPYRTAHAWKDIPAEELQRRDFLIVCCIACLKGMVWGLLHYKEMPDMFAKAQAYYEQTAAKYVPYGLKVSTNFPWESLKALYETCEVFIDTFEAIRPPLPRDIPPMLLAMPEIARRIRK